MKTGPSDWLLPSSPASQFLEALLETKTPPPGELFSVRKVISKQHTASAQPPIPEEGLLPPNLLTVNTSPEIVPDSGLEHAHWGEKSQELFTPSGSQTPFDVNNPFDPPNPSVSESSSHRPPSLQSSPRNPSTPQSPTTSTSSFSSFDSFDAELPDLPFLEDADGLPQRDPSRDRASEASVSGRVDGWELVYCFERPWDVEGDPLVDASLEPLLRLIPPPLLVGLLAALLRERRIAVVGPSMSDVSSTVFAACAVLHPFQWQHIFLPVLPEPFLHYLSAPMPFLVGVHSATWQKLQNNDVALGDIVVLDLGLGSFHTPFPDRKELPKDPAAALEAALKAAHSPSAARGAFLRFFLSLFGWYRRFIRFDQKGHVANLDSPFGGPSARCHLWFDHRTFADSVRDKKTAAFLNGFQGSQMYEAFVREVLARASECRSGADPFSTEVRRLYN